MVTIIHMATVKCPCEFAISVMQLKNLDKANAGCVVVIAVKPMITTMAIRTIAIDFNGRIPLLLHCGDVQID